MMTREEAIEVYNGLINTKIREAFQFFVPELRESEDERIRKGLITMLSQDKELHRREITWLEKQKDASKAIEAVDRIDKYMMNTLPMLTI